MVTPQPQTWASMDKPWQQTNLCAISSCTGGSKRTSNNQEVLGGKDELVWEPQLKLQLRNNARGPLKYLKGLEPSGMPWAFKTDNLKIPSRLNPHIKEIWLEIEFKWSMTSKVCVKKRKGPKEVGEGNRVWRSPKIRGYTPEHWTKQQIRNHSFPAHPCGWPRASKIPSRYGNWYKN